MSIFFRIILDLSRFFDNHKRIARVFIKQDLKTIQDLQNRISEIFGIHRFYLSTGGHFLPVSEDIRVLHNDETVCVSPESSNHKENYMTDKVTSSTLRQSIENKPLKRIFEDISEKSGENECEEPCNKKKVKKHRIHTTNENTSPKKETHRSKKEKRSYYNEQGIVEKEICNIETAHTVLEIKKKLKQKADEYSQNNSNITPIQPTAGPSGFKSVLPKLQSHIKNCNNVGRTTIPDTVRLSRHVDTPIKIFTKYTPPQMITNEYLAKTKINVVRIDVVNENTVDPTSTNVNNDHNQNENVNATQDYKSYENDVKTVVNFFEKSLLPNETIDNADNKLIRIGKSSQELQQKEPSNYTKTYLDESTSTVSELKDEAVKLFSASMDTTPTFKSIINNLTPQNNQSETLLEKSNSCMATDMSLDSSLLSQHNSFAHKTSFDSKQNSTNISMESNDSLAPKRVNANRIYGGVGSLVEHLRESDSVISQESDTSLQYVTKRTRKRKHRKKNKKNEDSQEMDSITIKNPIPKPMITKACPNIHIKFNDSDVDKTDLSQNNTLNDQMENNQPKTDSNGEMSSGIEIMVLSDECEEVAMENKFIFGNEDILKAPLMENNLEPKVGDIIGFKVLKMTADYTPQISNYIVGKVELYLLENKTIYFKILRGTEELLPPSGKLSLNISETEDIQNPKYKALTWSEILDPRLMFP